MYPLAESTVLPATSLPSAVARATSTSGASEASARYTRETIPSRTTTAMPPTMKRRDHAGGSPPPSRSEWSMRRLRRSSCLVSSCLVSVGPRSVGIAFRYAPKLLTVQDLYYEQLYELCPIYRCGEGIFDAQALMGAAVRRGKPRLYHGVLMRAARSEYPAWPHARRAQSLPAGP